MTTPRIETLAEKKLVGQRVMMSFADNKTFKLWRAFMPQRHQIQNPTDANLYSVEIYAPSFWREFDSHAEFEKWAAVEVSEWQSVPAEMETLTIPAGLYAVFIHEGPASEGPKTYGYIFNTWLPNSDYHLDDRPHFALMGEKYKNDDPNSEEEIWIPIRSK